MIEAVNPAQLDRTLTLSTNTPSLSSGEQSDSWSAGVSVFAKELRASGNETMEQGQGIYKVRRAYLIRKEDRTLVPATMRFREGSEDWLYMTDWHYWKSSRNYVVIEGEQRDE